MAVKKEEKKKRKKSDDEASMLFLPPVLPAACSILIRFYAYPPLPSIQHTILLKWILFMFQGSWRIGRLGTARMGAGCGHTYTHALLRSNASKPWLTCLLTSLTRRAAPPRRRGHAADTRAVPVCMLCT